MIAVKCHCDLHEVIKHSFVTNLIMLYTTPAGSRLTMYVSEPTCMETLYHSSRLHIHSSRLHIGVIIVLTRDCSKHAILIVINN